VSSLSVCLARLTEFKAVQSGEMINKCFVLLEQKNWDLCEEEEQEDAEEEDGVMVVVVVEEQQHGVQLM
jgi:hypothetical protein